MVSQGNYYTLLYSFQKNVSLNKISILKDLSGIEEDKFLNSQDWLGNSYPNVLMQCKYYSQNHNSEQHITIFVH